MSVVAELARMTAYFQARAIATHMGIDPNRVTTCRACGLPTCNHPDAVFAGIIPPQGA